MNKKLLIFIITIFICFFNYPVKAMLTLENVLNTKLYENSKYNVSLYYNEDWKPTPHYLEKYQGNDGFFQISAYSGEGLKIDEVAQNEVNHPMSIYGNNPQISKLTIQNQEARLIIPSSDQEKSLNNQAELIVKYPKDIKINDTNYSYLILWADKDHIQEISKTLKFIS